MRALLGAKVLKRGQNMPDESGIDHLVHVTSVWKAYFRGTLYDNRLQEVLAIESQALMAIAEILEPLEEIWSRRLELIGKFTGTIHTDMRQFTLDRVNYISRLKAVAGEYAAKYAGVDPFGPAGFHWEHDDWRAFQAVLAEDFRQVMKPNNPTMQFGYSNNGPVPRFIAAVTPSITGDQPSVEAVAQWRKQNPTPQTAGDTFE